MSYDPMHAVHETLASLLTPVEPGPVGIDTFNLPQETAPMATTTTAVDPLDLSDEEFERIVAARAKKHRAVKEQEYRDLCVRLGKLHKELNYKGPAPGSKFLASKG